MSTASRDNADKPPLEEILQFGPALRALAWHSQAGRAKYPDTEDGMPNWKLGGKPWTEYFGCALRHMLAYAEGEVFDPETGSLHLTSALWNLAAAITLLHAEQLRAEPTPPTDSPAARTVDYLNELRDRTGSDT